MSPNDKVPNLDGTMPLFQQTLSEQLVAVAARLDGLNEYDRRRLHDIASAMRRKEAELETLTRTGSSFA